MTDALGAWLLERPQERCSLLVTIRDEIAFRALIYGERAMGKLKLDDTTLAAIGGW
jgi:hypothetical protein